MSLKRKLAKLAPSFVRLVLAPFGRARQEQFLAMISPELIPAVAVELPDGKELQFYCPGELPLWRARTFFDKEPETLRWIDGFKVGETMWDIGANVGVYSLYAAARGCPVWAFEPSASNYLCLTTNSSLNELPVSAFCLAFSERSSLGSLHLSGPAFGAALHQFEATTDTSSSSSVQGMLSLSLDDFVEKFDAAVPSHIKIDVDGLELGILRGAKKLLSDTKLKSVLIELDDSETDEYAEATDIFYRNGFTLLEKSRAPMNDGGANDTIYNHVFVRSEG